MLKLKLSLAKNEPLRILCLGAHSDDIEMGCGGTLLRLLDEYDTVSIYWVVFSASEQRRTEAEKSAELFLAKTMQKKIVVNDFRESFFPYRAEQIKEYFESLKHEFGPDIVFTHYRNDFHQDHRLLCELTWNTFRDHWILEYEVIKYDGDLGQPSFFVQLNEDVVKRKVEYIFRCFRSQEGKRWFSRDAFLSILTIRGVECNALDKYAEAFYCRKIAF